MILITEEGVELDYVWVVQVTLDLDLSDQLVYEPRFSFKYFFGDFLEGADKVALNMPG